jgi:hypothetical protein
MSSNAAQVSLTVRDTTVSKRFPFFAVAHTALLAIVLVGFAPTFYLRAFFDTPPIPVVLYVHGAILTLWFSLTVVQGWLARAGRGTPDLMRWHRILGYSGALFAAIVVVSGLGATARMAGRLSSPTDPENVIVWGNYFTLVVFGTFVAFAVLLRKRPEAHRRLTLFASISIIGAALARFPLWPTFASGIDAARNFAIGGLLVMLAAVIAHDIVTRRKPHPVTWIGALAIFASIAAAVALGLSQTGFELLHAAFA